MEHSCFGTDGSAGVAPVPGPMTVGVHCHEPTSGTILSREAEGGKTFLDTGDVAPLGA